MHSKNRPAKKTKDKTIVFRVEIDAYNEIEGRALLAGKKINDWCRDELLARLADVGTLTANEELIHQEIVLYGISMIKLFEFQAKDNLKPENFKQLWEQLSKERKRLYRDYFANRKKEAENPD